MARWARITSDKEALPGSEHLVGKPRVLVPVFPFTEVEDKTSATGNQE